MVDQVGKSPMQVLLSLLHSNGYVYEITTTGLNELENLFFIHPTSFDIWRAFPYVLIIDVTYKANHYNMPFLEVVGVTSTNKTFSITFAFMHNEKTINYTWVLNCLKLTLMNDLNIMGDIPKVFHPYIKNIRNVKPDGNCGFRALVVCLGLDEHEYYEYIRQQMREELQNRYHIYADIFVRDVNSLNHDLCFFGLPSPEEHWMKMPEAGVLIANKFGVIVHSLSMSDSFSIFPFWSGPEEIQHHRALTIALVNDENHYVMVELQGGYPMPTIMPYWNFRNISMSVAGWETMYRWRLELYTQLYRRESCFVDLGD
ncbi:uncharacterized protein LOC110888762 [Helianthus annuus]|uniref:uncharacterized protein LOC110888762 n=1 Tax=Helianthus annuus TaxID=4232 RepID=UPI000B9060F5|nr:uncharacterized protein LOC110888762 [Helianthus annuus]